MPMYMDLPEVLNKYEGFTLTKDLIKKTIFETTPRYHDVSEYYHD